MTATRKTNQKLKIMQYLMSVKTHPTAEDVYNAVRKDLPAISLGTVYRNLKELSGKGILRKLEVDGEFHFDGDVCNHQHCICKKCGRIIDVFQKEISQYALKNLDIKGFTPECVGVTFSGYCHACK